MQGRGEDHLHRQARSGNGKFDFPFFSIEDVDMVHAQRIVVGNDDNLPFSAGRFVDQADADERILLDVGDFLPREQSGLDRMPASRQTNCGGKANGVGTS